ncbi:MAG: Ig-like domain-containing protein [Chloroflexota bacterium]
MKARARTFPLVALAVVALMLCASCSGQETPEQAEESEMEQPEETVPETEEEQDEEEGNQPPTISSLVAETTETVPSTMVEVTCEASDPDGDQLRYDWSSTGGSFSGSGRRVQWMSPQKAGQWQITVSVKDGHGGVATGSVSVSVVENRNPVISELKSEAMMVLPGSQTLVTCVASDPDGDEVSYTWKADGGEVTGVGDTVTWIAPESQGEYEIRVTVKDGHGGSVMQSVIVEVKQFIEHTETFTPISTETGTVSYSGDKDHSRTMAGDDEEDEAYHAHWSFDLYSLRQTDVQEATLEFAVKTIRRDPFVKPTGLGDLKIWQLRTEEGELPSFDVDPLRSIGERSYDYAPEEIDVTNIVNKIGLGLAGSDRLEVMAEFQYNTNSNSLAEYIEWEKATVTVTYTER